MAALLILMLVLPLTVSSQDDPCNNYKMLYDDGGRSIKCSRYYSDSLDRFIDEGWRRVQLESTGEDLTMPTYCIEHGLCGSHSNVWLNGTHPTVEDGIVDRMGCVSMFESCCYVQYPIQIKNCTDYMVYNLKRTLGSDERYCFGDSTLCMQTTRLTTVPTTTFAQSTRPTLKPNQYDEYNDSDDTILILGVCLSITIAILILVVLGILLYTRQSKIGSKYDLDRDDTPSTKA